LKFPHLDVVEGYIGIHVAVQDKTVIGKHRDSHFMGRLHNGSGAFGVMWNDHKALDPLGQEVFSLGILQGVVGIAGLHQNTHTQFVAPRREDVPVLGPPVYFRNPPTKPFPTTKLSIFSFPTSKNKITKCSGFIRFNHGNNINLGIRNTYKNLRCFYKQIFPLLSLYPLDLR